MIDRDPNNWTLANYLWVIGTALMGGFVQWVEELRKDPKSVPKTLRAWIHRLLLLFYRLLVAGFAGWLAAWVAIDGFSQPDSIAIVVASISGYLGPSLFELLRDFVFMRVQNYGTKRDKEL